MANLLLHIGVGVVIGIFFGRLSVRFGRARQGWKRRI